MQSQSESITCCIGGPVGIGPIAKLQQLFTVFKNINHNLYDTL